MEVLTLWFGGMYFDIYYFILVIPVIVLSLIIQAKLNSKKEAWIEIFRLLLLFKSCKYGILVGANYTIKDKNVQKIWGMHYR